MDQYDVPVSHIDLSHHLQRQIIMRLRQQGDQTYQALKPDGVEGNAYNYHLRQLRQAGFINGGKDGYTLTARGFLVSDGFSSPMARLMMRPYAHTSVLVTSGHKILLYKATRQPLTDIYTIPSGKMRYGDDLSTSLARELKRRDITDSYQATVLCMTNFRYQKNGEVIIHRPGTIWHIEYNGECHRRETPNGVSDWYDRNTIEQRVPLSPEVHLALERLETGSHEPIDGQWDISR